MFVYIYIYCSIYMCSGSNYVRTNINIHNCKCVYINMLNHFCKHTCIYIYVCASARAPNVKICVYTKKINMYIYIYFFLSMYYSSTCIYIYTYICSNMCLFVQTFTCMCICMCSKNVFCISNYIHLYLYFCMYI